MINFLKLNQNSLLGNSPHLSIGPVQDGAAYYYPLRGDMLRTYNSNPQV